MDYTNFGKRVFYLIMIGVFISFAGNAALMMTLPAVASFGWGMYYDPLFNPPSFTMFDAFLFGFIKVIISMFIPFIGVMLLGTYRKKAASILLFACGFFTIIPIISFDALSNYIQLFGILPFLPHVISGTIFIIAGFLAMYWQIEERPDAAGFISTTVDSTTRYPVMREPTCPVCGHGLFGDEKYCPECGRPLRKS